jgi:hypothetical protein
MSDELSKLETLCNYLNSKTSDVDLAISELDRKLAGFNLVTEVWQQEIPVVVGDYQECTATSPITGVRWRDATLLGCCQIAGKWKLATKNAILATIVISNEEYDIVVNSSDPTPLVDTPLEIRFRALELVTDVVALLCCAHQDIFDSLEKAKSLAQSQTIQ